MTANKTTLKALFETGDVPGGPDYGNFIDSCVNLAETAEQVMAGPLNTTELITGRVSAGALNCTGTFSFTGTFSAANISSDTLTASAGSFTDISTTNVSAKGTVYGSAARFSNGIVSAAGSTQATGAALVYTINLGAGVVDGSTTGFLLPANQAGRIQFIVNGGASANLWPPTGGQINALASNAAFGMAANTMYTILHTLASGYAVK